MAEQKFILAKTPEGGVDVVETFRSLLLFRDLPTEALGEIVSFTRVFAAYRGQTILEEGESTADIGIVLEGGVSVQIEVIAPHFEIGITRLNAGEVFGEMAMLEGEPRSATIVAAEPSLIATVKGHELLAFSRRRPEHGMQLMRNVAAILAHRLQRMNRRLLWQMRSRHLRDT